jgi:hypothetical protein
VGGAGTNGQGARPGYTDRVRRNGREETDLGPVHMVSMLGTCLACSAKVWGLARGKCGSATAGI